MYRATMFHDDIPRDTQAEPRPLRWPFAAEERFENMGEVRWQDATSVVGNLDFDTPCRRSLAANRDAALGADGLQGIRQQDY